MNCSRTPIRCGHGTVISCGHGPGIIGMRSQESLGPGQASSATQYVDRGMILGQASGNGPGTGTTNGAGTGINQ
jgi:hypothetical protein